MGEDFINDTVGLKSDAHSTNCAKPVILTFIGNYLPGYKAGGILRTIVNTVDHLCDKFEFRIVTRDRDQGENKSYPEIKHNQWQKVGNAMVYYLQPQSCSIKYILNLIIHTPHQVIYLNSFFDSLTIKTLLIRKLGLINLKHIIVAPRGEFAWASLGQKYPKKLVYILVARLFGFYRKVTWQASSKFEAVDIMKVMKIKPDVIQIALDLPNKIIPDETFNETCNSSSDCEGIRIVFLSRIAREKNLDYALRILNKVNAKVIFDIYGPTENVTYWKECKDLISQLPNNVIVNYLGIVNPNEVVHIFSCYDLFLFPSAGENYGHVIAEALTAGTPVLISTKTPWRNLQLDGLGWDVNLEEKDSFVETIERLALLSDDERLKKRAEIKDKIGKRLLDPAVLEANRNLFRKSLLNP